MHIFKVATHKVQEVQVAVHAQMTAFHRLGRSHLVHKMYISRPFFVCDLHTCIFSHYQIHPKGKEWESTGSMVPILCWAQGLLVHPERPIDSIVFADTYDLEHGVSSASYLNL